MTMQIVSMLNQVQTNRQCLEAGKRPYPKVTMRLAIHLRDLC